MTFILSPTARSAAWRPMLPRPITPSVLPAISVPMYFFFSQIPCFMLWAACGILRASENMRPMASSAAAAAFPCGVLITRIPFSVVAVTSKIKTPTPARPMILSLPGLARVSALILLAERTPTPWYSPITAASSSGFMPVFTSTVNPALLRISTAFLDMSSAMRTLIGSAMACSSLGASGLGKRRLRRGDARSRPDREAEIGERHLETRDGGDDVELAVEAHVRDAHDLSLQVILPARDGDPVARAHLDDDRRAVDPLGDPEGGDRIDRRGGE